MLYWSCDQNVLTTFKGASMTNPSNNGKSWTTTAIDYLVTNSGYKSTKSIAAKLRRTVKAVQRKAEKMDISLKVV